MYNKTLNLTFIWHWSQIKYRAKAKLKLPVNYVNITEAQVKDLHALISPRH